jgi:hypothetical protein
MFCKILMCLFVGVFALSACAQQKAPAQISKENSEILNKTEALKPPLLPQESIVAKEKTDAEDEGFKGKVKQVIEEWQELSSGVKVILHVMYFNEKGNFVERDYYSQGKPDLIEMYGYIDGKRVVKSKYIESENNTMPRPAVPKNKIEEPLKTADSRYNYSLEYKYVNGNLAQTQMISNRGDLGMRFVYKYTNNQVEKLFYTKEGDLNQKYLVTFDKGGNVVEEIFFGLKNVDIYGDHKQGYKYEFDKLGNWIKQTATRETIKNGISSTMPGYIKYRTIIYY